MDEIIEEKPEPIKRSDSTTCGKGLCEANAFKIKIRQLEGENAKLKAKVEIMQEEIEDLYI